MHSALHLAKIEVSLLGLNRCFPKQGLPMLRAFFLALLLLNPYGIAAEPLIDFGKQILPILSDHCFQCHGPDEQTRQADLSLHTESGALRHESAVIQPGRSDQSELVRRLVTTDADELMPPQAANRPLTVEQIELLKRWIDDGAKWGRHWAFELPQKPKVPENQSGIDYFVDLQLKARGIKSTSPANKETLLRRVTLDLTGLPPTLEELDDFLNDTSVDAYEKVVDRLLRSAHFGQRMAWDWLDAARYADTNGFQGDPERTMWPWRDWVVDAINANMPYDQFTIEQLAGDLLPNASREQLVASGFNRNNMHNGEGGRIAEETRVENVFDRVETTTTIWLGATFTCCRCHDHKFDPFTLRDYYGLYDIYNQMSETGQGRGGQAEPAIDFSTPAEEQRVKAAQAEHAEIVKEVEAFELLKFPREAGVALKDSIASQLPGNLPATLAKTAAKDRRVDHMLEAIGYFETDGNDPEYVQVLKKLLAAVRRRESAEKERTKVMIMDEIKQRRNTFILTKGIYDKPTEIRVRAALPQSLLQSRSGMETQDRPPAPQPIITRLELARWLVSVDNPLTARVTVNRFWQAFFGIGLVKTVEDFGVQGELPSHTELLDWLAVSFVDSGWDVKALCKQIVMSHTYQRSSRMTPELIELDPENRLLARGPRYRLPAWMIRDVALAASGLLVDTLGGPSVRPYQPEGIWEEATFGKKTYVQDHGESLYRRTLYIYWRRIVGPTMLFDTAARQTCSVKNFRTNTPLHALTTLNDIAYVEAARALAQRALTTCESTQARIDFAFRLVTSRHPSAVESKILRGRLDALQRQYTTNREAAIELLSVGESKRDEQLDPIEHAAYAGLCTLILNLDEAISKE